MKTFTLTMTDEEAVYLMTVLLLAHIEKKEFAEAIGRHVSLRADAERAVGQAGLLKRLQEDLAKQKMDSK